jgi:uncharacterized membrane protein
MIGWPHLHLLLNHAPVVGSVAAWLLLAGGLVFKSTAVMRAAFVAFAAAAVLAFAAVQTGERAEDEVENLEGVSEERIEEHEEAAELAAIALYGIGGLSAIGLAAFRRRRVPTWFAVLILVAGLAPVVLVARTSELGGRIRHPEIIEDAIF